MSRIYPTQLNALQFAQRGLVLFLALIALVVLSLAAVALIRTVDTATLIAGNLAFKQSASGSSDTGIEGGMAWLTAIGEADKNINIYQSNAHRFNITNVTTGYYSNFDPALDLHSDAPWNAITAIPEFEDTSGNKIRFIAQRLCRTANGLLDKRDCLLSEPAKDMNDQSVPLAQYICSGPGCPLTGQSALIRITARSKGPKNTISYTQAIVF